MFRFAYRNFSDHESFVVNNAVTTGSRIGIRWYELRRSGGKLSVAQQSTFAPDGNSRWMGSIALDKKGDLALGYSVSSASVHPSIRFTGRLAGDPAGQMTIPEGTMAAGSGAHTDFSRWGDYSSMSLDPADGCTFWYTNEYVTTVAGRNWRTRIGSFQLPGCASTTPQPALLSQGRPALASSEGGSSYVAKNAFDGSTSTRWASVSHVDPQWLRVDLGASKAISRVALTWDASCATNYQLQVSADGATFTTVYSTTTGDGGVDDIALKATGRYVRMFGTKRCRDAGYSLQEMQVFG
jgi:hypothetical protein